MGTVLLLKLSLVEFIIVSIIVTGSVNGKAQPDLMTDEEAAAKCDWNINFITNPQSRREICDIYCIMFYNGHDFPNESDKFPPNEEQFRECIQWSNVAGAPGICDEVHNKMRCVIKTKYGPQQEGDVFIKNMVFVSLIKELLNKN